MENSDQIDRYVVLLTAMQSRLYAYVLSLLGDKEQAADVLQNTNLALWRKAAEFDETRDFAPWAYRIAYLQVLAYRKKLGRERLLFDDAILANLSSYAIERGGRFTTRLAALQGCMAKLSEQQRDLVRHHYGDSQTIREIAELGGMSIGAVAQSLFRARLTLMKCIERETYEDQS